MGLVNRFTSGLVVPLSLSACAPKHDLETSLSSPDVSTISDDIRDEIIRLQDVADDQNISLESLVRTIYSIVNLNTNISEMMDPSLVRTLNPCKDGDVQIRQFVDSVIAANSPWEAKRVLLEALSQNPKLLREFKKSRIYTDLLFRHADRKCTEPEVTFRVSNDAKLYADVDFCGDSVEADISGIQLSGNLDWLRDHEQGTCNDRVLVFPNNDFNSIEVQKHSRDIYSVIKPNGITLTGDLSVLVPEMHRQEQNIEKSAQAQIDPYFYQMTYVSPRVARLIRDKKNTVNAQITHLLFIFRKHFGDRTLMHDYRDQSVRVIIGDKVIKVNLELVENAEETSYFAYTPHVLDCSPNANCEEDENVNFSIYSQSGQNFLNLNELIWWLDTNHVYSYVK